MAKARQPKPSEKDVRDLADAMTIELKDDHPNHPAYEKALILLQHEGKVKFNFQTKQLELV